MNEKDISTKRNAFILLYHIDQAKALHYLWSLFNNTEDPVADLGDVFQLAVLEVLWKMCKADPTQKVKLMNAIFMFA